MIDLQPCGVDPGFGLAKALETGSPGFTRYLAQRIRRTVTPAVNALLAAFHAARLPVFFTAFASAAGDGSDVRTASIRKRNPSGSRGPARRRAPAAAIPRPTSSAELDRTADDVVLVKQSMDTFPTTDLHEELQRERRPDRRRLRRLYRRLRRIDEPDRRRARLPGVRRRGRLRRLDRAIPHEEPREPGPLLREDRLGRRGARPAPNSAERN